MNSNSSDESCSSDNEFWLNLEKNSNPRHTKSPLSQLPPHSQSKVPYTERDLLLKTILNIREGKEVELQTLQIKLQNHSKKELTEKITEIKSEFLQEYLKLKSTYSDSQTIIYQKNAEISQLSQTVITQETLITDLRLKLENKKPQLIQEHEKSIFDPTPKFQKSLYKEIINQLKAEIIDLRIHLQKLNEENLSLKKKIIDKERKENREADLEKIEKLKQEKDEIFKEFERFKYQVGKEVELREMLNERHLQSISVLQEEIKAAKVNLTPSNALKQMMKLNETGDEMGQRITLEKPKARSLPKYSCNLNKIHSHYTYKEYKGFHPQGSQLSSNPIKGLCKPPKLEELYNRGGILSTSSETRTKFFKNSVLITAKDHR